MKLKLYLFIFAQKISMTKGALLFLMLFFSITLFGQIPDALSIDPNNFSKSQILSSGILNGVVPQNSTDGLASKNRNVLDTIASKEDTLNSSNFEEKNDSIELAKAKEMRFKKSYGKSFFDKGNLKIFRSASHIKAPDEYVLGPGDELNISVWGYSDVSELLRIADDGAVQAKLIGKIYLNGLSLGEARKLISSRYASAYDLKNSQISIQINYAKVIMVNIVGEVKIPGTYSVSSLNSAFNVISIAGGLTDLGSVRNILIKRDNKIVKVLDVYKFLLDPNFQSDFFLKNNDYIVVQVAEKEVEISGAIGRDGKYELTKNEGVADLVKYAGGLTYDAYTIRAHITGVRSNEVIVKDLDLQNEMLRKNMAVLRNGDKIEISRIDDKVKNIVKINGAIAIPGDYEFIKGEKVTGLLKRAQGVRFDSYTGRAYLLRTNKNGKREYFKVNLDVILKDTASIHNMEIQEFDEFKIFSIDEFQDEFFVEIHGAVRHSARIVYTENLTLQDMIFYAGGLKNEAANKRVEISRYVNFSENNENDSLIHVIVETYEISNDLDLKEFNEVKLRPHDRVFVRYTSDFDYQRFVTLSGEFKYPGTYVLLNSKETIKEVIERAGGFTNGAFLEGAKMTRSIDNKGKLVVDLVALYKKNEEQYNYIMRNGDSLIVPKSDDVITINGEIGSDLILNNDNQNVPFTKGRRAKFYIKEYAGGFTKLSNKNAVYVISASGKMNKSSRFLLFRTYPEVYKGDRIYVQKKPDKSKVENIPVDWGKVVGDITAKATGVLTLIVLFNKVFQ
jgi:polysaccharide export outer membrane protein